jgi:Domain of unknown function (DUF5753)
VWARLKRHSHIGRVECWGYHQRPHAAPSCWCPGTKTGWAVIAANDLGGPRAQSRSSPCREVAAGVGWSASKVSRFELGKATIPLHEVRRLLDFYGIADPVRSQLLSLAQDAHQRGWWEDFSDVLPAEYQEFIGLEAEAATVAQWQVAVVPGLLQTADYAKQLHLGYQSLTPLPPSVIDGRVRVRMIRQQTLTRDPPLQLAVVIDESVLLRRIGSRELMRAQLLHLAEVAELPNVANFTKKERLIPISIISYSRAW